MQTQAGFLLGRSTRDGDDLTIHPSTVVRGQESNDSSDVLWLCAAAERAVVRHHALDLLFGHIWSAAGNVVPSVLSEHVGFDSARGHAVDRDAPPSKVGGEGFDEANNGHLARVVQRVVLDAQQTAAMLLIRMMRPLSSMVLNAVWPTKNCARALRLNT